MTCACPQYSGDFHIMRRNSSFVLYLLGVNDTGCPVVPLASVKEQPGLLVQQFGKAEFHTRMGPPTSAAIACNSILINLVLQVIIHRLFFLVAK